MARADLLGHMGVVGRADLADRLDPMRPTMIVDEAIMACIGGRAPPSQNRRLPILAHDLIGLPSSRFSRSSAFSFSAGTPARCRPRLSRPRHATSVACSRSWLQSRLPPPNMRNARWRDPEPFEPHGPGPRVKTWFVVLLVMAPSSQELEPAAYPGRISDWITSLLGCAVASESLSPRCRTCRER